MTDPQPREPLRRAGLDLFVASLVVLFLELALIRWVGAQVRVVAYFPNLILLAAFLGLGIGCLLASRKSLLPLMPAAVALLIAAAAAMGRIAFTGAGATEHLWLLYNDLPPTSPVVEGVRLPIVAVFLLTAAAFIPLGQLVAERLRRFGDEGQSLLGYTIDLAGSLTGVITFSLLSFLGTFPIIWFSLIFLAVALFFLKRGWKAMLLAAISAVVALLIVSASERATWYSPYYALRANPAPEYQGFVILANGALHQFALPLRRSDPPVGERAMRARRGFHIPYELVKRRPRSVLIVGGGTGNDAAVALDEGVERIDVVEIDPVILRIGREYHPNHPYSSPKVHTINADARSFLNQTTNTYDLIVFGTLDSMTRLSALSNVRLDNFVYTEQCLRAARRRLNPDGGMALYFQVAEDYIDARLTVLVARTFEQTPVMVRGNYENFNHIYLGGPAFSHLQPPGSFARLEELMKDIEVPSDDWPYLYLEKRALTPFYVSLIVIFLAIAVTAVAITGAGSGLSFRSIDVEMFFFGIAFLLLETKSVTEMNLVWGATWLTSAIVFASILLMILGATLMTRRKKPALNIIMPLLFVALLLNYFTPAPLLLSSSVAIRLMLSALFVGAPILFASVAFAIIFGSRAEPQIAFAWNLLGAVVGGLAEFASMVVGLKALTLIALACYLAAYYATARKSVQSA